MADQSVSIDETFVQERVGDIADDEELSNFIL
jgi:ATP-dependent protease HslVU (ClpYQ) ATPase subunit